MAYGDIQKFGQRKKVLMEGYKFDSGIQQLRPINFKVHSILTGKTLFSSEGQLYLY